MRIVFNPAKGQQDFKAANKANAVAHDRGLPHKMFKAFHGGVLLEINITTRHLHEEAETVAKLTGMKSVKVLA